ncbi:NAD(P)-binding Rossmann-fold superfamily protein [Thalictrum thalictroides]|uniref:NAD(P)-binding Rossmann-fold superfamily protein n=1 Tax=Thalictrum thalictroides TaxID=46969 RepID=A0A7J6V2L8_THATH|nr:NAD(P)-binding Rossmann-fold superfamily protein [Thalictrum thalictroides]
MATSISSSSSPIRSSSSSPNSYITVNPSISHLVKLNNNQSRPSSSLLCCSSKKNPGFMDQILDYIEGGPKLRKWYGAPDLLPKDGDQEQDQTDDSREEEEIRDAVLVTDGDTEIGQMVILALIIKRARIKALVKDKRAAIEAYGTYIESIAGDRGDSSFLKKALKGVRAIICPSNEGFLSNIESIEGVQHVVYLSQSAAYRDNSGIKALMTNKAKKLFEQDELLLEKSRVPYTIIRAGLLQSTPGGKQGFSFDEGSAAQGKLSKEDAAFICVQALDVVPQRGVAFEVVNGDENISDWKEYLSSLIQNLEQLQ